MFCDDQPSAPKRTLVDDIVALAQRVIDGQVKEIDRLRALVQALRAGDAELRRQIAELGEKMLRLGGNHD